MLEQACRSQPAQAETEMVKLANGVTVNGQWFWIVQVGYMEGVGTGLGQNALGVCEMELKVQKLPCFARGR